MDDIKFYTDSKVVLGYIYNRTKRFYVYVSNHVGRNRKSSRLEQWHHVPSELNPADHATRPISASVFATSSWLTGPEFLLDHAEETTPEVFSLLDPDNNPEIRSEVKTFAPDLNPDLQIVDLVLLKDQQAKGIEWPMGLIVKTIPSDDGMIPKVEVKVARQGTVKTFLRPITELVLLLPFGD